MNNFPTTCSFYSNIFKDKWPSMRLGLFSPKKYCAILNNFVDQDITSNAYIDMVLENNAVDLSKYYLKHKQRWQTLEANKRKEISNHGTELKEDAPIFTDHGSADDLVAMFSDKEMDNDEKYFVNRASTNIALDDFVPPSRIFSKETTLPGLSYLDDFADNEPDVDFINQDHLEFDDKVKIVTFPKKSWKRFDQPKSDRISKLMNYYLMDGASALPAICLGVKFGDVCADFCAAPGGKALYILMTLKPSFLQLNDLSQSRLAHLRNIFRLFTPDIEYIRSTVRLTNGRAESLIQPEKFDKILVDVPCSNDKNSLDDFDRSHSVKRITQRQLLPQNQMKILRSALISLKPGGSLVYSTCTLSPIENDGVVNTTLKSLNCERKDLRFAVVNMDEAFRPLKGLFELYPECKYGQLVIPQICSNFGPMYICKIKRVE